MQHLPLLDHQPVMPPAESLSPAEKRIRIMTAFVAIAIVVVIITATVALAEGAQETAPAEKGAKSNAVAPQNRTDGSSEEPTTIAIGEVHGVRAVPGMIAFDR